MWSICCLSAYLIQYLPVLLAVLRLIQETNNRSRSPNVKHLLQLMKNKQSVSYYRYIIYKAAYYNNAVATKRICLFISLRR